MRASVSKTERESLSIEIEFWSQKETCHKCDLPHKQVTPSMLVGAKKSIVTVACSPS